MRLSRRSFLVGSGALPLFGAQKPGAARPKIAAVCTAYFKHSHSQHIVDRFIEGYGWNGRHHFPAVDLVSLFVDQVDARDWSRERLKRHPEVKGYSTIAEALTLGGGELAVDGVVLVGEHGKYARNEKGQTQYPRYEFFQEIVTIFHCPSDFARSPLRIDLPPSNTGGNP